MNHAHRTRRHAWRKGRRPFAFRAGLLFAPLLFLILIGAAQIIGWLLAELGIATLPFLTAPWPLWVAARVAFVALLFLSVMRRVGRPLGDVVDAADRVGEGDFTA